MSKVIDCRGLRCPEPVIQTKKYFESISEGEAEVVVDNEIAKNNILKLCKNSGYKGELKEENHGFYKIVINKEIQCKCEEGIEFNNIFTIVISTNKLGEGSEELGAILMKSYLFALSESDQVPTNIIFLNSGVMLTTSGSEVLSSLKTLQEKGANILSCGTCLDYYNLKDKLEIGEISNMYTIVEKMNNSNNTIKL
ncbi:sulfurtransferase-like selenium metabolism protein YedF [Clostridium lundense]|uniref:sulfurtransferase-like selenium metabolism protein YedF n=1 Tax=Clostridium lundense TaxID=319475 RepID=UPI000482FD6C|nr:sulfurtransferase-like selenium metabolism protein YedF [Clostridium lundense]